MKNAIMYYYNLIPNNIRLTSKYTKFSVDNSYFVLELLERNPEEIKEIYELSLYLLQLNVPCHQIIPNINNQIITIINNQPYVLMKILVDSEQLIDESDLLVFENIFIDNNKYKNLKRNNWAELWAHKIDYLEYQVSQFGKKYSIIRDSFSYHIGLAENALQFFKTINNNVNLCVSHRRIKKDCTMYDLYNPLEFIIDSRIRDYSEYYKQIFFNENVDFTFLEKFIYNNNLTEDELKLLFCRMLFPTTYFDMYEDIVIDGVNEKDIIPIITKVNSYDQLLKTFYSFLTRYYRLEVIEWLITNT